MSEDRDILLKLRRFYSKEETVALLSQELSHKEIEIGQLKSEVARLEDELAVLKKEPGTVDKLNERIVSLQHGNETLRKKNKELIDSNGLNNESAKKYLKLNAVYKDLLNKYQSLSSILISKGMMPTSDYYTINEETADEPKED